MITKEKAADRSAADSLETKPISENAPAINQISSRAWEGGRLVPVVNGAELTEFDQPFQEPPTVAELLEFMPPARRRRWEMIVFSLRYLSGVDPRSFAEAGKDIGCSAVAVFKVHREVLGALRALGIYDAAIERASERREAA